MNLIAFSLLLTLPAQEVSQSGLRLEAARPMIAQPERAPRAMVATVNEHATDAAIGILKRGGNAVDAAVAVAFALAVVHPEAGNLGGSGYMMIRLANGKTTVIDYGVNSPLAVKSIRFTATDRGTGYKSIGIPGTPAGMGLAHARYGKLSWRECLEPARRLSAKGFPASQRLELILKLQVPVMKDLRETAAVFLHGSDQPLKQGELVVQRDLADTIARMQRRGWQEFYTGETGRRIVADMATAGSVIRAEDLARYEAREKEPLELTYRGVPVVTTPLSSAGGIAQGVMLNTLGNFDLKLGMEGSVRARHLQIEAMRAGFAARRAVVEGKATPAQVLAPEYAKKIADSISIERAPNPARELPSGESPDTTHFTIADELGNVVANTYTLNGFFGSQVIPKGTGVLMNNYITRQQGDALKAGERIPANMSPTMILRPDRSLWAAFGTPGAMTIASTLMQITVNLIDFKMSLRDAVEYPRIHFGGLPGAVDAEPAALVFDVAERLQQMGHRLNPLLRSQGDVSAIAIEEKGGWKQGWADGRRGGVVKGY